MKKISTKLLLCAGLCAVSVAGLNLVACAATEQEATAVVSEVGTSENGATENEHIHHKGNGTGSGNGR